MCYDQQAQAQAKEKEGLQKLMKEQQETQCSDWEKIKKLLRTRKGGR